VSVPEPGVPAGAEHVLRLAQVGFDAVAELLSRYDLSLVEIAREEPIPGSYWGDCEAGIIASRVFARADTPIHSLLHEACHLIVLPAERRASVHTDATDCTLEEDAACYLQIVLADQLPGVGSERLMADMDAWGYSFRLGATRDWFERDAEDARQWLAARGLLDPVSALPFPPALPGAAHAPPPAGDHPAP